MAFGFETSVHVKASNTIFLLLSNEMNLYVIITCTLFMVITVNVQG
jgi:hypothetical protein